MAKNLELYRAFNAVYPAGDTQVADLKLRLSKAAYSRGLFKGSKYYNVIYCRQNTSPTEFVIVAQSASKKIYKYNSIDREFKTADDWAGTHTDTICADAGIIPLGGATGIRDIFYFEGVWQPYIRG